MDNVGTQSDSGPIAVTSTSTSTLLLTRPYAREYGEKGPGLRLRLRLRLVHGQDSNDGDQS